MNAKLGILLKIMSALCATLMLACVKGLHGAIPTGEVIFFRSFVALFPLLLWLKLQGSIRESIKTQNIFGHVIRGLSGTGGMYFNYLALIYISLADATAISYAVPLFTVLMAAILLKETVRFYRWLAVLVGFSGIVIMLSSNLTLGHTLWASGFTFDDAALGTLFALLAALCSATSNVQIRFLNGVETPGAIVFYFSLMTTLIGCGVFSGLAQILVTLSLRYADASLLAPFDYTTLVWSMVIGYLFLDSLPGNATLLGASIIVMAGIFTLWCDQRQRKRPIIRAL